MKKSYTKRASVFFTFLLMSICLLSCSKKKPQKEVIEKKEVVNTPFFKLSLAQWSLHKAINDDKTLDPVDFAQKASEMGFEGLEYVNHLYAKYLTNVEDPKVAFKNLLDTLKAKSEKYKMKNLIIMVDGEGDLAATDEKERNQAVENHKKWVDAAAYLGCHSIRVNTFGTTNPDEWVVNTEDGLRKLSKYAASKNINVLVENHGWLSSDAPRVVQVMKAVNMENCGTLPDFGNWCVKRKDGENWGECLEEYPDMYDGIKKMMPYAKAVSAKSYDFDTDGNETKIDYKKMLQIVKDANYNGYIGVEYEGSRLSEEEGIDATKNLILKVTKELN